MKELQLYFDRLSALSTTEIDRSAQSFVAEEKKNVACLIAHLSEIDRRKIHLELGYKSLFEYATKRLCLGEGTVYLRIQVARVCRRFPQVLEHLGGRVQPAQPDVYNFRFSAGRIFKEKLERLSEVLGIEDVQGQMAALLEKAVDVALDRKDPKRRQERRERRADSKTKHERKALRSRHVPAAVRDRVFERADYQCEFRGQDGRRCSQRARLEVDHDPPWATGADHDETKLRALCRRHNQFSAERFFGADFVAKKIHERRQLSATSSGRGRGNSNRPVLT